LGQSTPVTIIAGSFARLKESADLGCHLCSVLLDTEWTALASSSKVVLTRRLKDMDIPPNFFLCKIEDGGKDPVRHFVLNASSQQSSQPTPLTSQRLVLTLRLTRGLVCTEQSHCKGAKKPSLGHMSPSPLDYNACAAPRMI